MAVIDDSETMTMATTASPFDVDFEANAKRIRELNDKVLTAAKQTGAISLDNYEQTVHSLQDFGMKVADSIRPELISEIVNPVDAQRIGQSYDMVGAFWNCRHGQHRLIPSRGRPARQRHEAGVRVARAAR